MMVKATEHNPRPAVHPLARLLLLQLGVGVTLAALFWSTDGSVSGYSALLGGLICVIPNAFLALRLVAPRRDRGPRGLLHAAYIGELGKLVLTVLLFGAAFVLVKPLAPLPLFMAFIACQLATLAGLLMRDGTIRMGTGPKGSNANHGD